MCQKDSMGLDDWGWRVIAIYFTYDAPKNLLQIID